MKRKADVVKKDNFKTLVAFGDVSHLPLDHLNSIVEAVSSLTHRHTHTHSLSSCLISWCSPLWLIVATRAGGQR